MDRFMWQTVASAWLLSAVQTTLPLYESTHFGVDLDLDIYYTAVSAYAGIGQARPEFGEGEEGEIYRYLVRNIFKPHSLVFEASTYPMPLAGVGLKTWDRSQTFYRKQDLDSTPESELNWIQILTAGFEEPYAFSLFAGNLAAFRSPVPSVKGVAYAGYLFSFGTEHIKNNILFQTPWYEFEAKLKGDDIKSYRKLKWSYRVGARIFESREISNYVYLSTLRDRIDFSDKGFGILRNSFLEASIFVRPKGFPDLEESIVRAMAIVGKNFPFYKDKVTFSLGLGAIVSTAAKYKGCLRLSDSWGLGTDSDEKLCRSIQNETDRADFIADNEPGAEVQFLVRPNVKF